MTYAYHRGVSAMGSASGLPQKARLTQRGGRPWAAGRNGSDRLSTDISTSGISNGCPIPGFRPTLPRGHSVTMGPSSGAIGPRTIWRTGTGLRPWHAFISRPTAPTAKARPPGWRSARGAAAFLRPTSPIAISLRQMQPQNLAGLIREFQASSVPGDPDEIMSEVLEAQQAVRGRPKSEL